MSTIQLKNSKTGFTATASMDDWNKGVYDKSVWSAISQPAQSTQPTQSLGQTQVQQIKQAAAANPTPLGTAANSNNWSINPSSPTYQAPAPVQPAPQPTAPAVPAGGTSYNKAVMMSKDGKSMGTGYNSSLYGLSDADIKMLQQRAGEGWALTDDKGNKLEFVDGKLVYAQTAQPAQTQPLPQTPDAIYTMANGQPIDPSKHTNLQPGTPDFENWLKENNIKKVSTSGQDITANDLMDDQSPDLLTESNKMNLSEQAKANQQYYGKTRVSDPEVEKTAANELAAFLDTKTVGGKTLRQTIGADNWSTYVNAYVYGGYSMQDIANDLYARATGKGGGIVHPTISRGEWFQSQQGKLPGQDGGTAGGADGGMSGGGMSGGMGNVPQAKPTPTGALTTLNNPYQQIVDKLMNLGQEVSNVFDQAAEKYGLMNAGDELNNIETQMADAQIRWRERERELRAMTGSQNAINRTLSEEGRIANAELADLAIRKAVAQADWERAYQLTTTAAEDFKEAAMYQIQALEIQGQINEKQAQEARAEIGWFNEFAMSGYTYLKPSQLAGLTEDDILRVKNPYTGQEMIFKAPVQADELNEHLSITEAKTLGVPYGTTKRQAMEMGITPAYVGSGGGSSTISTTKRAADYTSRMSLLTGADGFISPDDYASFRKEWVDEGLNPTDFDNKMKGFRNPNNPNYITNKEVKYTATTIPLEIRDELIENARAGASLDDLIDYYPDVSTSYLNTLWNQNNKKGEGGMTDAEFEAWLNS
jgi:hypothetical protein